MTGLPEKKGILSQLNWDPWAKGWLLVRHEFGEPVLCTPRDGRLNEQGIAPLATLPYQSRSYDAGCRWFCYVAARDGDLIFHDRKTGAEHRAGLAPMRLGWPLVVGLDSGEPRALVVASSAPGILDILLVGLDSGLPAPRSQGEWRFETKLLYQSASWISQLQLSPDHRLLAFAEGESLPSCIKYINLEDLSVVQVLNGVICASPQFSWDGSTLGFVSEYELGTVFHRYRLDCGEQERFELQLRDFNDFVDLRHSLWGYVDQDHIFYVARNAGRSYLYELKLGGTGKQHHWPQQHIEDLRIAPAVESHKSRCDLESSLQSWYPEMDSMLATLGSSSDRRPFVWVTPLKQIRSAANDSSSASLPPRFIGNEILACSREAPNDGDALSCSTSAPFFCHDVHWEHAGKRIHGLLYWPKIAKSAVPLIVPIHDGPHSQVFAGWQAKANYFCRQGYAVFYVNYRGSTGYGREFREDDYPGLQAQDIVEGLKQIRSNWPISGIALWGGRYGGRLALRVVALERGFIDLVVAVFVQTSPDEVWLDLPANLGSHVGLFLRTSDNPQKIVDLLKSRNISFSLQFADEAKEVFSDLRHYRDYYDQIEAMLSRWRE